MGVKTYHYCHCCHCSMHPTKNLPWANRWPAQMRCSLHLISFTIWSGTSSDGFSYTKAISILHKYSSSIMYFVSRMLRLTENFVFGWSFRFQCIMRFTCFDGTQFDKIFRYVLIEADFIRKWSLLMLIRFVRILNFSELSFQIAFDVLTEFGIGSVIYYWCICYVSRPIADKYGKTHSLDSTTLQAHFLPNPNAFFAILLQLILLFFKYLWTKLVSWVKFEWH